jgi:UDP-2,3-diacylglucosamine hydrolase
MTVPHFAELVAPQSWRTVDFISDIHLSADEPATFEAWRRFMATTPADAVFMLGDIFEVWIGDDVLEPRPSSTSPNTAFEARCASVMQEASKRFSLFFMHGNRDFLVGQKLMDRCGTTLLADPTVLVMRGLAELDGTLPERWLLSHGDALCLDDVDYMRFREQVRGSAWQQEFLAKPIDARHAIARLLRQQSQARKTGVTDDADVDASAAVQWLAAANASTLIHGHTHRPAIHNLGSGLTRVVLSDWHVEAQRLHAATRGDVLRLSADGLNRLTLVECGA